MAKILLIGDELKLAGAVKEGLEKEGYYIVLAKAGEEAF